MRKRRNTTIGPAAAAAAAAILPFPAVPKGIHIAFQPAKR